MILLDHVVLCKISFIVFVNCVTESTNGCNTVDDAPDFDNSETLEFALVKELFTTI